MKVNDRAHALEILTAIIEKKSSLTLLTNAATKASPMTKELCYGVCRHYVRLSAIAKALVDKKPKNNEVWLTLLMGLYQLQVMQLPDYAVVQETVNLLNKTKYTWAKGLLNAVLRNFCRQKEIVLAKLVEQQDYVYNHPAWLLAKIKSDWPNDWQEIAKANDAHPPMILRVNLQKTTRNEYLNTLTHNGIEAKVHEISSEAICLATPCDVSSLPLFAEGYVSLQDAAAQLAVSLLALAPGQKVLDACCAPGGKTCHILEMEPKLQECVAVDVDVTRLKRVTENLSRLGLQANVVQQDALSLSSKWEAEYFDRILLDAPCSAIGVIRRHSDIKLLRTEEEVTRVMNVQKSMLDAVWPLLAKGGRLVYATCSILKQENEQQIEHFLSSHPDCMMLDLNLPWGRATGYGQQILPGEQGMDGFFYCVLMKQPSVN